MLHNNSHQGETNHHKLILFTKLLRQQLKTKERGKFEEECVLLIFIYSNSKLESLVKTWILNADASGLIPKKNH